MRNERKKVLVNFAKEVAQDKYRDDELMEKLSELKPTFEELIFMDDLIQNILEGEKENER